MKKSYLIAIVMSVLLVIWMASGLLSSSEQDVASKQVKNEPQLILVETQMQTAQPVQLNLTVQGQVEPRRKTPIRSDLAGRITDIYVKEGDWVASNTTIFRLDPEDREIKLAKENALLLSKQQTYERAQDLVKQNLQAKSSLESDFAALKTAEANVAQIKLEISKLSITAPFDGVIDQLNVEQNGYIMANSEVAQFVDNSTLIIVVPVAQQDIHKLSIGLAANVKFATGESRMGKILFISSLASENTRTFRVEISINNQDRIIPAGISAEVDIPIHQVQGHFISPAILALDAAGQMGVKSVDDNNIVVFTPISIIQASTDGVWVKGLPNKINIITIGQGFVEAGAEVNWTPATVESTNDQTNLAIQSGNTNKKTP